MKILCLRTVAKPSSRNDFNKQWTCKGNGPSAREWVERGRKGGWFVFQIIVKPGDLHAI